LVGKFLQLANEDKTQDKYYASVFPEMESPGKPCAMSQDVVSFVARGIQGTNRNDASTGKPRTATVGARQIG
jgi:hypothetical protein